jgi:predicted esterase
MAIKIEKSTLKNKFFSFDAMAILPDVDSPENFKGQFGVFTHGYTASKTDCLPWAQRFADAGAPAVFFDLPGHYLGSFKEVESFTDFKMHAQECFSDALDFLNNALEKNDIKIKMTDLILGGHSLGALLALKALDLEHFDDIKKMAICVGLGISQHKDTHLFESSFYQKTLDLRRQLVSPALDSDNVFPWIKEEKIDLDLMNKKVHLITGLDDIVVGTGGLEALEFNLKSLGNDITSSEPKRLPHHEPSSAASHINAFMRKEFNW